MSKEASDFICLSSHPQDAYLYIICDDRPASFYETETGGALMARARSLHQKHDDLPCLQSARELFCVLMLLFYRASRPSFRLDITQQYVLERAVPHIANTLDLSAWRLVIDIGFCDILLTAALSWRAPEFTYVCIFQYMWYANLSWIKAQKVLFLVVKCGNYKKILLLWHVLWVSFHALSRPVLLNYLHLRLLAMSFKSVMSVLVRRERSAFLI